MRRWDVTGYLEPGPGAGAALAANAGAITTLVVDDATVTASGTSLSTPARRYVAAAHRIGARAEFIVSNWQGNDFSTALGARALAPAHRRLLAAAIAAAVADGGWDGVTLDFENLPVRDRRAFPAFVADVRAALAPTRRLAVDVPASADRRDPYLAPYDDAALARHADALVLMAYDEHSPGSPAGPISGCPWVRASLAVALATVPADKLELGEAGYGYRWSPTHPLAATTLSDATARRLAAQGGVTPQWVAAQCSWRARLADGAVLWWSDRRTIAALARVAAAHRLAGVALWALDLADPLPRDGAADSAR